MGKKSPLRKSIRELGGYKAIEVGYLPYDKEEENRFYFLIGKYGWIYPFNEKEVVAVAFSSKMRFKLLQLQSPCVPIPKQPEGEIKVLFPIDRVREIATLLKIPTQQGAMLRYAKDFSI